MRRHRARATALLGAAVTGVTFTLGAFAAGDRSEGQDFSEIQRGRYLTAVADCAACHTLPGSDQPFAGGRPIETPFGIVAAPNITPDAETGIGAWSDAQFDAALRLGKRRDGSHLFPAMPYPYYTKMSQDDVLAIRAYLRTIAPVRNAVVADRLPFPLSVRAGMLAWNALYFTPGAFKPDPSKSGLWNRGAYLVEAPAHCGACHTPKTWLGGDKTDAVLLGYTIQGWFAPDITNDERRGLGRWNVDDIVAYLRSGHNRFAAATGPMAEEVSLSSSRMTEADLKAIATYLKDLPGEAHPAIAVAASVPAMQAGASIYRDICSACHTPDGRGVPQLFPSLAGSPSVQSTDPTSLIRVVLHGARSVATQGEPTAPAMPAYGRQLDDTQAAAVLTYIRNSWGNSAQAIAPATVASTRAQLAHRPD